MEFRYSILLLSFIIQYLMGGLLAGDANNTISMGIFVSDGKTQRIVLEETTNNSYAITENIIHLSKTDNNHFNFYSNENQVRALLDNVFSNDLSGHKIDFKYSIIDENLVRAFYSLREKFTQGISELNIPILDPYKANDISTNLKNKLVNANIQLSDLNVHGLKEVEASYITLKLVGLYLNFELTLKELVIDGKYKVKGKAAKIVPFSNRGDLRVHINDIHVTGSTKISIKTDDKTLYLEQFDVNILNGDIKIELKPVGTILGWILKTLVQSMTAEIAEKQKERLEQELKTNLWTKANETLSKYTLNTLLDELSKVQ